MSLTKRGYAHLLSTDGNEGFFRKGLSSPFVTLAYPALVAHAFDSGVAQTASAGVATATATALDASASLGVAGQTATAGVATATAVAANAVAGSLASPSLGPVHAVTLTPTWNGTNYGASTTFTVEAEDTVVLLRVAHPGGTRTFTLDGEAFSLVSALSDGNSSGVSIYEIAAPATGTYTLAFTASSSSALSLAVCGVRGCDATTPRRVVATEVGWNQYAHAATSERMDLVVDALVTQYATVLATGDAANDAALGGSSRFLSAGHRIATGTSTELAWSGTAGWAAHVVVAYMPVQPASAQTATAGAAVASAVALAPSGTLDDPPIDTTGLSITIWQDGNVIAVRTVLNSTLAGALASTTWALTDGERLGLRDVDAYPLSVTMVWTDGPTVTGIEVDELTLTLLPSSLASGGSSFAQTATCGVASASAVGVAPSVAIGARTAAAASAAATAVALGAIGTAFSPSQTATPSPAIGTALGAAPSVSLGVVSRITGVATANATALAPTLAVGGRLALPPAAIATAVAMDATAISGGALAHPTPAIALAVGLAPLGLPGGVVAITGVAVSAAVAITPSALTGGVSRVPTAAIGTAIAVGATGAVGGVSVVPSPAVGAAFALVVTGTAGAAIRTADAAVASAFAVAITYTSVTRRTPASAVATAIALNAGLAHTAGPHLRGVQWVATRMRGTVHVGPRHDGTLRVGPLVRGAMHVDRTRSGSVTAEARTQSRIIIEPRYDSALTVNVSAAGAITTRGE